MRYQEQDLKIHQGDDVSFVFDIVDDAGAAVDLSTGHTAKMQARIAASDTTPLIALTKSAGLTLGNGTVTATLGHAITAALDFDSATYELEITETAGGTVKTVRRGTVRLIKEFVK